MTVRMVNRHDGFVRATFIMKDCENNNKCIIMNIKSNNYEKSIVDRESR